MNDGIGVAVAASVLAFAVPGLGGAGGILTVARRWRDRPAAWSLGWLCVSVTALSYAAGASAVVLAPGAAAGLLLGGFTVAAGLGGAWLVARTCRWFAGRAVKRLAAAQGLPVPRGRLTAPVLVLFYVAAMIASLAVAAALWMAGATWLGEPFHWLGMPLTGAITPMVVLCGVLVVHLTARELIPLLRDVVQFMFLDPGDRRGDDEQPSGSH